MAFPWLFRGPLLSRKTVFGPFSWLFRGFFVAFSWLFRGPRFGQNLRVLALEQSSDRSWFAMTTDGNMQWRLGERKPVSRDSTAATIPSLYVLEQASGPKKHSFERVICSVWVVILLEHRSWLSGRGGGQQLFSFQSPAVQWLARTSSLNCLSCRNPYQTPHSLDCLPPFSLKNPFFNWKVLRRIPFPKIGSESLSILPLYEKCENERNDTAPKGTIPRGSVILVQTSTILQKSAVFC